MKQFKIVLVLFNGFTTILCANILFITTLPSPSHHIWNEALVGGLLKNEHNITLLGYDKQKILSPNYTLLEIQGMYEQLGNYDVARLSEMGPLDTMLLMWKFLENICDYEFQSPALQKLLSYPNDAFDMIIFDLNSGHCLYPLIDKFGKPPVIGVSPFGLVSHISRMMGNHIYPYIPYYSLPYTDRMTFRQRFINVLLHNLENLTKQYMYLSTVFKKAQKFFGNKIRSFEDVEHNITLLLASIDSVLDYPQPVPPNIIPVGGLHVKPAKQLPKDLLDIIDGAKDGAIYFSLGTNVEPENLDYKQKKALLDAFDKLPHVVLCKLNEEENLNIPKNVILRKWFPQNDILGHKNVKLFVTHGGALSTQEAMYHGVPLVGMPIFADQINNIGKIEVRGLGRKIKFTNLTSEIIYNTIQEVLKNSTYRNNMKAISKKFRDQPQTPLERAVFWIEYVLRNGDANHLNIAAKYMIVPETLHLDIYALLIIFVYMLIFILYKMISVALNYTKIKPLIKSKEA